MNVCGHRSQRRSCEISPFTTWVIEVRSTGLALPTESSNLSANSFTYLCYLINSGGVIGFDCLTLLFLEC